MRSRSILDAGADARTRKRHGRRRLNVTVRAYRALPPPLRRRYARLTPEQALGHASFVRSVGGRCGGAARAREQRPRRRAGHRRSGGTRAGPSDEPGPIPPAPRGAR